MCFVLPNLEPPGQGNSWCCALLLGAQLLAGRLRGQVGGRRRHGGAGAGRPSTPTQPLASDSLCIAHRGRSLVSSRLPPGPCPPPAAAPGTEGGRPQAGQWHIQEPGHPDPCPLWGGPGRAVPEGPEEVKPPTSAQEPGGGTAGAGGPLCNAAPVPRWGGLGVRPPGAPPPLLQLMLSNRRDVGGHGGPSPSLALQPPPAPGARHDDTQVAVTPSL